MLVSPHSGQRPVPYLDQRTSVIILSD